MSGRLSDRRPEAGIFGATSCNTKLSSASLTFSSSIKIAPAVPDLSHAPDKEIYRSVSRMESSTLAMCDVFAIKSRTSIGVSQNSNGTGKDIELTAPQRYVVMFCEV